jgi:hypothetical protein
LYEDAHTRNDGEYQEIRSDNAMAHAFVWTTPHTVVGLTQDRYDNLMYNAQTYTPLIIVATPEGIYEFNMDVQKVEWEPYSDGESPDILVTDLALSTGKHILPFYPEFSSEEDYLDSLMGDAEPSQWDEGDEW